MLERILTRVRRREEISLDDRALDFYNVPSAALEYQYRFFTLPQTANIFLFTDAIVEFLYLGVFLHS